MRLQQLQHEGIVDELLVVQLVQDGVVPERSPAFVHDLGLTLRIEVLRDLAHDAHDLSLPGLQLGRVLLDEVEKVFLRLRRKLRFRLGHIVCGGQRMRTVLGQCAPQVIDLRLQVFFAFVLARLLFGNRQLFGPAIAVHTVVLQCVAGIEQQFHFLLAIAAFAFGHIALGEQQVVDDGVCVGPGAEQVVALEEGVVAVAGMRDRQRLHGHRVLLHQVGDAGVGVDDDLVRQPHLATLVATLRS